jgi:hypothetical protein
MTAVGPAVPRLTPPDLDPAGSGLHDGSNAGAGTDLRSRPSEQHAYRPGRNAQQAVIEVEGLLFRGHPEVVDADLADYFGSAAPKRSFNGDGLVVSYLRNVRTTMETI